MKKLLFIGQKKVKNRLFEILADKNIYVFDPETLGSAKIIMQSTILDLVLVEDNNDRLLENNKLLQIFASLNPQSLPVLVIEYTGNEIMIKNIWSSGEKKHTLSFEGEMQFTDYLRQAI